MRIYHTETQEDYNALMVELEAENYVWSSGYRPTEWKKWSDNGKDTCVAIQDKLIYYSNTSFYNQFHPDIPIVEYKLKFTKEKVALPKFVADYLKERQRDGDGLFTTLYHFQDNFEEESIKDWIEEEENIILFTKAWINGYTIEPEQLYYIPLPDLETSDGIQQVLSKRNTYFASRLNDKLKQQFTQQWYTKEELEQVPEIYKQFAKPIVEE